MTATSRLDGLGLRHALWGLVAVLVVALPFTVGQFTLFLGASILALGLYGASYDLLYGYTGLLSFGHAVFFGVGAYAATFALADYGMGVFVGLAAAFLAAAVVAVGFGLIAVRVSSHGFVIVTILIALIANLAASTTTDITGGTDGLTVVVPDVTLPLLGSFSLYDPVARYYFTLAVLAVSLFVMYRLVTSPVGLAFRMIRENEQRARMLGYNVTVYKLAAFIASGAFAGVAGALSTYITGFVSASEFSLIVSGDAIIFTLIGGRGTLIGAVLGAAIIEGAANYISGLTDAYPLFIGALLVITVVLEPEGVLGLWARVRDRLGGLRPGSRAPDEPETDASPEVTTDE